MSRFERTMSKKFSGLAALVVAISCTPRSPIPTRGYFLYPGLCGCPELRITGTLRSGLDTTAIDLKVIPVSDTIWIPGSGVLKATMTGLERPHKIIVYVKETN